MCAITCTKGNDISIRRSATLTTAFAAAAASLTACSTSGPHAAAPTSTVASSPQCAASRAPLVRLPAKADREPAIAVPQPAGWNFVKLPDPVETRRAALVNAGLQSHNFNPSALVTLVDVTTESNSAEQALATEQGGVAQVAGHIDSQVPGTVCGQPSVTLTYTVDGRQDTQRIVAAKDHMGFVWVASVQVQSADPDKPNYVRDKQTILDGFQFTVPDYS
jgi:hypothetical protein